MKRSTLLKKPKLMRKSILNIDKPKKVKRSTLINKADRLFSLKIREIGVCQLQGKDHINCSTQLQCAHITTRGKKALRWDFNNAICICSGHHIWYTKNPNAWGMIIEMHYPDKWAYMTAHQNDVWDKNIDKILEQLSGK